MCEWVRLPAETGFTRSSGSRRALDEGRLTTGLTLTDRNVTRGRTYWYAVRAYDGAGNRGAASATASATAR